MKREDGAEPSALSSPADSPDACLLYEGFTPLHGLVDTPVEMANPKSGRGTRFRLSKPFQKVSHTVIAPHRIAIRACSRNVVRSIRTAATGRNDMFRRGCLGREKSATINAAPFLSCVSLNTVSPHKGFRQPVTLSHWPEPRLLQETTEAVRHTDATICPCCAARQRMMLWREHLSASCKGIPR